MGSPCVPFTNLAPVLCKFLILSQIGVALDSSWSCSIFSNILMTCVCLGVLSKAEINERQLIWNAAWTKIFPAYLPYVLKTKATAVFKFAQQNCSGTIEKL